MGSGTPRVLLSFGEQVPRRISITVATGGQAPSPAAQAGLLSGLGRMASETGSVWGEEYTLSMAEGRESKYSLAKPVSPTCMA